MTARRLLAPLVLALLGSSLLAAAAAPAPAKPPVPSAAPAPPLRAGLPPGPPYALDPASTGGIAEVDRDLQRLVVDERLLVVGAHPDDEDTALLALVSRGLGGEAAYMALSRGEGGQNVVGPELGADLGLIRTQELLAARRVDGGRQYFSRAFDFGYTTSLAETLEKWPKAALLEDVVRVIRRFRPQVIVSVFPNDGRGGHGQHQAAGVVAHEAFKAAGDPKAFPELAKQGLPPWKAQALYRETWFDREATTMTLPIGVIDPLSGHSIYQIAAASRSRHRSQSMGRLEEIGPREARLAWVAGAGGKEATQPFAGVDTRLRAIAALLPEGEARSEVATELDLAERSAAAARAHLAPEDLAAAAPDIAAAAQHLELARERAARLGAAGEAAVEILEEKLAYAHRALAAAAGLVVDATTARAAVVPGEPVKIKLAVWNAGTGKVRLEGLSAQSFDGWKVDVPALAPRDLAPGELYEATLEADPTAAATPTQPYFLRRPRHGEMYDWSDADPLLRGEPFGPPPVVVAADLTIAGTRAHLLREAVFRTSEEAVGEVRQPLRAVPAVEVAVEPHLLVWPLTQAAPRALRVELQSNSGKPLAGELRVQPPAGWPAVAAQPFSLAAGERASFAVTLLPPQPPQPIVAQRAVVRVEAAVTGGATYGEAAPVIDLPHIPPTPRVKPAAVDLVVADIRLPALRRLGYVRGASDEVPEALEQIGLPVELLAPATLASGDLSRYDAIVIGSRAYETSEALRRANPRLLEYVRGGGLVIVQYQQYPFVDGKFAPLSFDIARPHDRVTDENAPVTVLAPQSPVFTTPNRIGPDDWKGWVQERGLYFAHSFDPGYTPLLEMADKGQAPQRGSLLVAKVGAGTYVYTGLAFFRQLPAGVPGAYRLFANLLALHGGTTGGATGSAR